MPNCSCLLYTLLVVSLSMRLLYVYARTLLRLKCNPSPVQVLPVQGDVRDVQSVKAAADACVRELGLPQIIINNAAGNFISPTERLSPNAFKTVVDIVLLGSAYVTLEFGKRLIEAEQGLFLNVFGINRPFGMSDIRMHMVIV